LSETDRVLLDVKYTTDEDYRRFAGCELKKPLAFLSYLNEQKIPTTLRQVIIPKRNDSEENAKRLKEIANAHPCVDKIELLPFRKICQVKYDSMNIPFPFADLPEPTAEMMQVLNTMIQ
jgi:pyruvate formate lyase activating enzyme